MLTYIYTSQYKLNTKAKLSRFREVGITVNIAIVSILFASPKNFKIIIT
jgi:hypothetical protein